LVTRTKLIDDLVLKAVNEGTDRVLNLAAGLDTRPYRLPLPAALSWVEADLSGIVRYKERVLDGAVPKCQLSREVVDLADAPRRRAFLERALAGANRALVITEGLLMYLNAELVGTLAQDLAAQPALRSWVFEIASPGTLRIMKRATDRHLAKGSRMQFAPGSGVAFFAPWGWKPLEVHSLMKCAARYKRLPLALSLGALLPEPKPDRLGLRPWGGVVRLTRI
jgi:methyltransferase (TIGR00027 family)